MFFVLIAVAVGILLVLELFYFRHAIGKALVYWGCVPSSKRTVIIKYSAASVLMGISIAIFTVPGLMVLHFLLVSILTEVVCLFIKLIARKELRFTKFVSSTLIVPLIIAIFIVIYGYINMHNIKATVYDIETNKNLERDYKIVFLSDLHVGVSIDFDKLEEISQEISDLSPDMLLLGGDIVDESTTKEQMQQALKILGAVKTVYGVFYIDGNHDIPRSDELENDDFSAEDLNNSLMQAGITVLRDKVIDINNDLVLIGHRDASFRGNEEITSRLTIEELMSKADKTKFSILLDHQPREYERCKNAGVNLMLSGHTHAGQLWPASWFTTLVAPNEQNYGIETDGEFSAIVSSGIAGWSFPIKTEKHAEYVIVNISSY